MRNTFWEKGIRWLGYAAFVVFIFFCGTFGVSKLDF